MSFPKGNASSLQSQEVFNWVRELAALSRPALLELLQDIPSPFVRRAVLPLAEHYAIRVGRWNVHALLYGIVRYHQTWVEDSPRSPRAWILHVAGRYMTDLRREEADND